jgi:hypothetical protein
LTYAPLMLVYLVLISFANVFVEKKKLKNNSMQEKLRWVRKKSRQ